MHRTVIPRIFFRIVTASEILKNLPIHQVTDVDFINLFTDNVTYDRSDVFKNRGFYDPLASVCKSDVLRYLNFNYSSVTEFDSACDSISDRIALSIFHFVSVYTVSNI